MAEPPEIPPHMPQLDELDFEKAKLSPNNATLWSLLSDQMLINRQLHLALMYLWPGAQHQDMLDRLEQSIKSNETRVASLIAQVRDE